MIRHKPLGEELGETLSQGIGKLQLTDNVGEGAKDVTRKEVTSHHTRCELPGLFSIIKIEEEHSKIDKAIKRAKRRHNILDKITPGRETQTQGGRGVVTGIFWEDEIYPPLPKTNDLTFAEKDRAKQGLTSVQCTRESQARE